MQILRLVIERVLLSLLTLLIVSLIIFFMLEILPGDVATRILGRDATPETLAALRQRLHLDTPALLRYAQWLGNLVTGHLGRSLVSDRLITTILAPRILNTVLLSIYAFILYIPLTAIPAMIQAVRRDRAIDHGFSVITLVLLSMPDFLLGTILLILFVIMVPILPAMSLVDQTSGVGEYMRAMTLTAVNLAYLVGGVVVVEKIFGYPGFGSLLVDALQLRDLPLIEATIMIAAAVYIAANLMADVGAILLNPRLRQG